MGRIPRLPVGPRRPLVVVLLSFPLLAQQQPTFHAAWQDGLEAEQAGRWAEAAAAFRRALELRPAPASRVVIYGNNLLMGYYPRTHLARCLVELGDLDHAEQELQKAGGEPAAGREPLMRRIHDLRARTRLAPPPSEHDKAPAPLPTLPAPTSPSASTAPPASAPLPSPSPAAAGGKPEPPQLETAGPSSPKSTGPAEDTGVLSQRSDLQPLEPKAPGPSAPPSPPSEPPKPLPWIPLGLSLGLALIAVWAWSRRRGRRFRLERRGAGKSSFSPGALPQAVGPYRIERLLGRGGFSDTFLARHERTGQEVALKVPHLHRADDAEFRQRFHQEAALGARLIHPNLVRILDPGQEGGRPYMAMEYLPGVSLETRLAVGALPLEEAVGIALGVTEAMLYAHAHGVVHRDLKPGNILLTNQGPKVMDLGIARIMDSATVTSTYAFLGTPLYASPEAQLKTHVGPAADRYSLGVILFHLLAGRPPFQGETPFVILDRHRRAQPPDLALLRPDTPPALVRLVARLLDKEPDQRPEDSEVRRVLLEVASGLSDPATGAQPG